MKERKSLVEKRNPYRLPASLARALPSGCVRFGTTSTGGSHLAYVRHLLPTPFSFSARLPTPNRSSWPPRHPAVTASHGATCGATPVVASQLDWTINYPRFLFMI